jgi:hypothetical protein
VLVGVWKSKWAQLVDFMPLFDFLVDALHEKRLVERFERI